MKDPRQPLAAWAIDNGVTMKQEVINNSTELQDLLNNLAELAALATQEEIEAVIRAMTEEIEAVINKA